MSGLRVALIYPPPWKIPEPNGPSDPVDGPPPDFEACDLDADFFQIPYGLLSLAAQAIRAGHCVKVLNLSGFPWSAVEHVVAHLEADVVGMSCWTANRRGVRLVSDLIKQRHPTTHVTIGGPHVTPLGARILERYTHVDSAVLGEGEHTFLELLDRLQHAKTLDGLPGAITRAEGRLLVGASRPAVSELDTLESPHRHFSTHIVMTSRGCPWACTFCGAESTWGRGFRPFGVERVLDDLQAALERTKVRILLIKDDTFTTNRDRIFRLCRGIRERKLDFLWSCDTRVDVMRDDLMREMRLAGCERVSLGVESGSASILKAINKKISIEQILASTEVTRRYGIRARFFMMLGNRGETKQTFLETLEFLERARPHQYIFSCLSIYPGTADFHAAVAAGWLDPEQYFTGTFQEYKVPFDASPEVTQLMNDWFSTHRGVRDHYVPTIADLRAVHGNLGVDHAPALLDLAEALIEHDQLDEASQWLGRVELARHPLPGLVHNALACLAAKRGDWGRMKDELVHAARLDPQHYVLLRNARVARDWFDAGGRERGAPLSLQARHDFQLFERTEQPALPGPIPNEWLGWAQANPVTRLPSDTAQAAPRHTEADSAATRRSLPTV